MSAGLPMLREATVTPGERRVDAVADRPDRKASRLAWQREMERAQAANWFHGSMAAHGRLPSTSRPPESAPRPGDPPVGTAAVQLRVPAPLATTSATFSASAASAVTPSSVTTSNVAITGPFAARQERVRVGQVQEAGHFMPSDMRPVLRTIATRSAIETPVALADRLNWRAPDAADVGVQVHCESRAGGIVVWLGVQGDAQAIAQTAAAALAGLRQAWAGTPQRLARVVCNGQVIWSAVHEGVAVDTESSSSGSDLRLPGISNQKEL